VENFELLALIAFPLHLLFSRIPLALRGGLLLLIVVAVLHTLDRQGEFVSRTDFLWKAKLKVEQEEVETMRGINKVSRGTLRTKHQVNVEETSKEQDVFA
jgi:hypothetical protein